ncbi:hypothetical protein DU002_14565 [Corallincola holothuriorum]|uniref:Uncharacterized protein n=1 Tax=Corallincola holothuriorum TaxID=2282215 RepID=A0A368N6B5_9GAMM|nr:hypothetical protein [Corallincola holothuriorum]RCU45680.1 hypothetical protein DU002_14565 [Corallincola holothuriorum]
MTEKPEFYAPDLTEERLQILSERLLEVLDEAQVYAESPNATAWFKGTANYGLPQGMLMRMHENKDYPWLTLANKTMDYAARIGGTLVQFIVDDPHASRKHHRLKRNAVERYQFSLDLEVPSGDEPLIWRFYLNPFSDGMEYSPTISLLGYDSNENIVCHWEHEVVISGPRSVDVPVAVEIEEPVLTRKQDKQPKQANEKE